jgi:hypothetical protein
LYGSFIFGTQECLEYQPKYGRFTPTLLSLDEKHRQFIWYTGTSMRTTSEDLGDHSSDLYMDEKYRHDEIEAKKIKEQDNRNLTQYQLNDAKTMPRAKI